MLVLIRVHLANPSQTPQESIAIVGTPTPQQIVAMLSEMLTQEDWQAIAKTASQSIASQVLRVKQRQSETAVA